MSRKEVEFTREHEAVLGTLLGDERFAVSGPDLDRLRLVVETLYLSHQDLQSSLIYAVRRAREAEEEKDALQDENESLTADVERLEEQITQLKAEKP